MPGNALDGGPVAQDLAVHAGDSDGVPGSWLRLGPNRAIVAIWGVSQQMEDTYVSPSLSLLSK